jgi:hypothetical protein
MNKQVKRIPLTAASKKVFETPLTPTKVVRGFIGLSNKSVTRHTWKAKKGLHKLWDARAATVFKRYSRKYLFQTKICAWKKYELFINRAREIQTAKILETEKERVLYAHVLLFARDLTQTNPAFKDKMGLVFKSMLKTFEETEKKLHAVHKPTVNGVSKLKADIDNIGKRSKSNAVKLYARAASDHFGNISGATTAGLEETLSELKKAVISFDTMWNMDAYKAARLRLKFRRDMGK